MTTEPTLNLQKIQTLLHSSHMDEPIKALKELEAFPLKGEVLETYIHILDHALWKVRKLAARRLEQEIGITFPHVAKCILDETADRRYWAMHILPAAGKRALKPLMEAVERLEHPENLFALKALSKLKEPSSIPFALEKLKDPIWSVRKEASELLWNLGSRSIQPMKKAIQSGTDDQRYWCFKILGRIGGTSVLKTLMEILVSKDYDDKVRSYALSGIQEVRAPQSIPIFINTLDSDLWVLRAQASKALMEAGRDPHRELVLAMKKGSRSVRYWGAIVLKEIVEEKHTALIEQLLKTPDLDLRFHAISILGKIRSTSAVELLAGILTDSQWYLRKHATDVLISMGPVCVAPLATRIEEGSEEKLYWICQILGEVGQPTCFHALEKLVRTGSKEVRLYALEAIACIGGDRAVSLLIEAFDNQSWVVRSRAHEYLLQIGPPAFLQLFEGLLNPVDSMRFWCETTIEESEYYGARTLMKFLGSGTERESQDILNQLSQLTDSVLMELYQNYSLKPQDVLDKLSIAQSLNTSALTHYSSESASLEFSFFQKSEYPYEQVQRFKEILKESAELGATQLHLRIGTPPMARVDGVLCKCGSRTLTNQDIQEFLSPYLSSPQVQEFQREGTLGVDIPYQERGRFKAHIFRQSRGVECVLHYSTNTIPDFQSLNLPSDFLSHIAKLPQGLILISGPNQSGKSTCCISLLSYINRNFVKNIMTVEDRIEYPLQSAKSLVSQKEMGNDLHSLSSAVESLSREDPDVAYLARIPESRSLETLLQLACSRSLVIVECNANSSREAIEKILYLFPPKLLKVYERLFQSALQASVHIRLLNNAQESGLVPGVEYFLNNSKISECLSIESLEKLSRVLRSSRQETSVSLDDYLMGLASEKKITYQEAVRFMEDKSRVSVDQIW
jgi:twitching motility protein PilT